MSLYGDNRVNVVRHMKTYDSGKKQNSIYTVNIGNRAIEELDLSDIVDLYHVLDSMIVKPEDEKIPTSLNKVIYHFPGSVKRKELLEILFKIELEHEIMPDFIASDKEVIRYEDYRKKKGDKK